MPKRLLRIKEIERRLGVGHTKLYEDFINTGRLKLKRLGPKSVAVEEDDLDKLIDELPLAEHGEREQ